jgi:hypothetical protein
MPAVDRLRMAKLNKSDSADRLVPIAKKRRAENRPKDDFFSVSG